MHQTTSPVTLPGDSGSYKALDFRGWNWLWNSIESTELVPVSLTTIACSTSDGVFHVNGLGSTTLSYKVHLEGQITSPSSIPVPLASVTFSKEAAFAGVLFSSR